MFMMRIAKFVCKHGRSKKFRVLMLQKFDNCWLLLWTWRRTVMRTQKLLLLRCRNMRFLMFKGSVLRRLSMFQKMLKRTSQMKRPAAVFTPKRTVVKVLGGDNFSDAEFSRLKRGLRRVNEVGRLAPAKSHVDPLAMQRLLDKPGLETVLAAMQFYRSKRMGHIGYDPACFGSLKDHNAWLGYEQKALRARTTIRNVVCVRWNRQPRTHMCWFYPGEEDAPLNGFDITQVQVYGGATLNCQVLAALQCRAEAEMDTNKRKEHLQQLKDLVAEIQTDAVEKARSTA